MSNAIGRITAALASVHNENAVSLANLNFDFTLVKLEAPAEFQGVGRMISKHRKTTAEEGLVHKTAQKLGALFASKIPSTSELYKAYGTRVSEICKSESANPRPNVTDGIFASYVGADCTSIWAAVTSSEEAIGVHLLACMLARMWNGTEATSVWDEMVTKRKLEIAQKVEDSAYPSKFDREVLAAHQDISREELASWDASARSWIQCADQAKAREQKQLMLMLDNINIPINSERDLYSSVVSAWTTALVAMNTLLKGIPQQIQDGAALLGISSWHLFPDLEVLGTKPVEVSQKDELFQTTALLTLGLQFASKSSNNVSWSLPLARMKYYGDPVHSQRTLGHDTSRITMDQFGLGGIWPNCRYWNHLALKVKKDVGGGFKENEFKFGLTQGEKWLSWISDISKTFSATSGTERQVSLQLVGLGRRRSESLCPSKTSCPLPLFGLADPLILLRLVSNKNVRLRLLRLIARNHGFTNSTHIIRYCVTPGVSYEYASVKPITSTDAAIHMGLKIRLPKSERAVGKFGRWLVIFKAKQSVTPLVNAWQNAGCFCSPKCSFECPCLKIARECSSTCHPGAMNRLKECGKRNSEQILLLTSRASHYESLGEFCFPICEVDRSLNVDKQERDSNVVVKERERVLTKERVPKENIVLKEEGALPLRIGKSSGASFEAGVATLSETIPGTPFENLASLKLVIGDHHTSGIYKYIEQGSGQSIPDSESSYVKPEFMEKALASGKLLPGPLTDWLDTFEMDPLDRGGTTKPPADIFQDTTRGDKTVQPDDGLPKNARMKPKVQLHHSGKSQVGLSENEPQVQNDVDLLQLRRSYPHYKDFLVACSFAAEVYKDIPGATISTTIASQPLWESKWFSHEFSLKKREATAKRGLHNYARIFACIAMFDTGMYNLDPVGLSTVFALSSGNSIYVAAPVMDDPAAVSTEGRVRHMVGNVGRPGLSFLIPPAGVKTRRVENDRWMSINHAPFDGKLEDCFQSTTIHLGFTAYALPLHQDYYTYNIIDRPASLVETLVSVHDRGQWIADLDILGAMDRIHQPYSHRMDGILLNLDPDCGCQSSQTPWKLFKERLVIGSLLLLTIGMNFLKLLLTVTLSFELEETGLQDLPVQFHVQHVAEPPWSFPQKAVKTVATRFLMGQHLQNPLQQSFADVVWKHTMDSSNYFLYIYPDSLSSSNDE
ncbi:hypothetical protein LARI1_G005736 [Lachnellula arida]|uniref:Uncharacterized protein n=1 Tax=Lachnellula arida TaxID=1316785 RepID=A0A8T9BBU5_9HELO|nr:hypothetical protein LARI1_G005736 [Lachnellula arida]